jgi:hypothetical protein
MWYRRVWGMFKAVVQRARSSFVYDNETCVSRVFAYI